MPKAPAGDEPPENEKTRGDHEGHRGFDQFLGAFSGVKPSRTLGPHQPEKAMDGFSGVKKEWAI